MLALSIRQPYAEEILPDGAPRLDEGGMPALRLVTPELSLLDTRVGVGLGFSVYYTITISASSDNRPYRLRFVAAQLGNAAAYRSVATFQHRRRPRIFHRFFDADTDWTLYPAG